MNRNREFLTSKQKQFVFDTRVLYAARQLQGDIQATRREIDKLSNWTSNRNALYWTIQIAVRS